MDITFRTLGAWGAGKGANLEAGEVDANFWSLAQAIVDLQSNPAQPNGIASITVSGTQMTIYLTDGTVMGPFILPVLTFRWRGEYDGTVIYAVLDVFTVTTGNPWVDPATVRYGIFMVQIAGTYGDFDPDATVGGEPAFLQLFGAVDNATLSNLADVDITTGPFPNDVLVWDAVAGDDGEGAWVNQNLGDMAFQFSNSVHISGGSIGGLPAPALPGDAATKAYVDAMPAGMMVADRTMMANISGLTGPALANTLSDFLDYALLTSARGTMLYRGAAGWVALAPGTAGLFLKTAGAGADPTWSVGGSGVTSVAAGAGITTGAGPITATGSVALASVADNSLLANITGSSAAPTAATLSAFLDHVASSTRGAILTRAGSGWVALAPGTSGYYLQTQGSTADAVWSSPSGSGTVTSISAGTGISTGGAPITGAGTVSLAAIGNASVLANISGSSAAPVPATVSVLFDSVFGSTQGAVLYRNATTWMTLAPGTSGQILTSGGAAANPAWAAAPAGASVASLRVVSNISGSTAAPIGNTLSDIFDAILGSSRGMLVYRGSAGWAALSPGTTGDVLTTGGTAGDPHWAATAAGASISVGDTAPASPSPGDAWWDSLGGQLYIRYNDGTSSQWVPASNQPGPAGTSIPLPVTVANGGTGSTTAGAALTALGAAPLNAPVFTGDARAVTPATADNDTSVATTAYVQAQGYATTTTVTAADNLRVLKAGDTMTGNLMIASATGSSIITLNAPAGANNIAILGQHNALTRWGIFLGDAAAESGSNSGCNFGINRNDDSGGYLGTPLTINRATGDAVFAGVVTAGRLVTQNANVAADFYSTSNSGGAALRNRVDTVNAYYAYWQYGASGHPGDITTNGSTVSYNTTSDARLKENIKPLDPEIVGPMVDSLEPVEFDWLTGEKAHGYGFLAQDVYEVFPDAVTRGYGEPADEDFRPWGMDNAKLVPLLIAELKSLRARVQALEGKPA